MSKRKSTTTTTPGKAQVCDIAAEVWRIADHIEGAGMSSHARLSVMAMRRGPLLECIRAVYGEGPEYEIAPAPRIRLDGRAAQTPKTRPKNYLSSLSAEQLASGDGELLGYLNNILILCARATRKAAPETKIVSGLRAAAQGLRRWAGLNEEPDDLATITVVMDYYVVSRSTLKRAIQERKLTTYRRDGRGPHLLSLAAVGNIYPRR